MFSHQSTEVQTNYADRMPIQMYGKHFLPHLWGVQKEKKCINLLRTYFDVTNLFLTFQYLHFSIRQFQNKDPSTTRTSNW